jgi:hypothetical protein
MGLENALDVRFAGNFYIVAGLVDVKSIVAVRQSGWSQNARPLIFGGHMRIDNQNQCGCSIKANTTNCKIINLTCDKYQFSIDHSTV